jgi:DNA-binding CsgD family transcriptional regulator
MGEATQLERGRRCYERRAWADAFESLSLADREAPLEADDLERLAFAASLAGHDDAMLATLERAYQAHLEGGRDERAARAAFWASLRLRAMGEYGRATGWHARAQRIVERQAGPCVVEGLLMVPIAFRHLSSREYDAASETAARAAVIGEKFGDADLVALARNVQGCALIPMGQIERGLALLDEVMLAAAGDQLSTVVTGLVYCSVLAACQRVYALDRAREWTTAIARWSDAQPQLAVFAGSCLVHRAEVLQLGGAWPEAIAEARRACARAPGAFPHGSLGDAHYQEGEIHRLRGAYAAAEEAYRTASANGRDPQPGLALLRLAQGQREAAATAMRRVVGAASDPMQRIQLLPAYVEVMLAAGDVDEARKAARELDTIATSYPTDVLRAIAEHARGAVCMAEGDAQASVEPLRRAHDVWHRVGAPYIAARIRVLLGCACHALGDDDGAKLEIDAARDVFQRLGAAPDIAAIDALLEADRPAPASTHGLTARELQVLRLVASGKTNKVIAQELCLSEKTIDRHVSNIFTKIDVASRAAATAFAYEHHLV